MRFSVAVAIACLSVGGLSAAEDVKAAIRRTTDIPAQGLGPALQILAKEHRFQIVYVSDEVNSLRTQGASGELTVEQALTQILRGTGLTFRSFGDNAVSIEPIAGAVAPADRSSTSRVKESAGWFRALRLAQADETSNALPASTRGPTGDSETAEQRVSALEEVIVTAQKRSERLQDVPISISVLDGDALDSSTGSGVTAVLNSVPGVTAQESYIGGGTQLTFRGVAAANSILNGSSPVAYYLDSIPFGLIKNSVAPDSNAYDMERVEILRGPQGTLYGASALNGVVRVLTKDADLDKFDLKVRTLGSSTDNGGENYRGDAALNVPLVEGKLAARAVLGYENYSGWIDRASEPDANDSRSRSYRLKVNAQPAESLSIGLSAWSSNSDQGSPSQARNDGSSAAPINEPMSTDYETYGLRIAYDFRAGSISSVTGYLDYHNSGILEMTPINLPGVFTSDFFGKVISQEINFDYTFGERWRWTAGGIYRDAKDRNVQSYSVLAPAPSIFNDTSRSYALFSEVTRAFLDGRLELTAGLRHFEDEVGTKEISSLAGVPAVPIDVESRFNKTTPRVVLNWHPSSRITAYASYAEGFRSGFQQQPPVIRDSPQIPPVDADSLKNYELGMKGSIFGGRLSFDTALYFIDWQDVQSNDVVLIAGAPAVAVVNGESASGAGVDLSISAMPVDRLELSVSFSANDLTWDASSIPGTSVSFSKGDRLNLSPKYTAGRSASYTLPFGSRGYQALISASARYNSEQFIKISSGFGQADSILIADARFSIQAPKNWAITLYADNLNNEDGVIQQAPFNVEDWSVRPRPRTLGLQVEYRW